MTQQDLFAPSIGQRFEAWKATPGGRHVLRHCYRLAAAYGERYRKTRRPVSMKLIWELLRDRISLIRSEARRLGVNLDQWEGFALNNIFTSHLARHVMAHRPEWAGMFETRELRDGQPRKRKVIVIEEA